MTQRLWIDNRLALALIALVATLAATLKVVNYQDATRTSGDLRAEANVRLKARLIEQGYVFSSEQLLLGNDQAVWFSFSRSSCVVHATALDPAGVTISAFTKTALPEWRLEFLYSGRRYEEYPRLRVTLWSFVLRGLRTLNLVDFRDGLAIAVQTSPECPANAVEAD